MFRAGGLFLGCVLAGVLGIAASTLGASDRDRKVCCWKILVTAEGNFDTYWEPRISDDPDDHGHHRANDRRGKFGDRWKWQSRGLYSYRELRTGKRRVPYLEALPLKPGSAKKATTRRTERHFTSDYCIINLRHRSGDVVEEECREPPINPCLLKQSEGWKKGGGHSGVRAHGGTKRADRRIFLNVWVASLPYDDKCVQFGSRPHHSPDHALPGANDYVLLAPRKLSTKLRARRRFAFKPRTGDFSAFAGQRPAVAGTHEHGEDRQPHGYSGKTRVKVRFVYFPKRKLRDERRRLHPRKAKAPRPQGPKCSKRPALSATPTTIASGAMTTFRGACFRPRRTVTLRIGRTGTTAERFTSVRTSANGRFAKRHRFGQDVAPGTYVVLACQNQCRIKASTRIKIGG